jgi:hypothetical protein
LTFLPPYRPSAGATTAGRGPWSEHLRNLINQPAELESA